LAEIDWNIAGRASLQARDSASLIFIVIPSEGAAETEPSDLLFGSFG
jgi:hypothetical protein